MKNMVRLQPKAKENNSSFRVRWPGEQKIRLYTKLYQGYYKTMDLEYQKQKYKEWEEIPQAIPGEVKSLGST